VQRHSPAIAYGDKTPIECTKYNHNPRQYPIFAESRPDDHISVEGNTTTPGIFYSGLVRRAYLPLNPQERTSIASYDGTANIFEVKVLCYSPDLTINSFNMTYLNVTIEGPSQAAAQIMEQVH